MPYFSIVTSVFDPDPEHLAACLASVDAQTESSWEHVVVDDASTDPAISATLMPAADDDRRTVRFRSENGGIVAASNDALARATGEVVVLLDHDDLLDPTALAEIRRVIEGAPATAPIGVVYSDHDLLRPDGRLTTPVYKPDFSIERLRNHNYITHLVAIRRDLLEQVGGFRDGFDGAQDHDLLLRLAETGTNVAHLPAVLAHWRQAAASVASSTANKPQAYDAGVRAVQDHLDRVGVAATVSASEHAGVYRIDRQLTERPTVSVVIPAHGASGRVWGAERIFVHEAVRSLTADVDSTCALEFVVVLDDDAPPVVRRGLERIAGDSLVLLTCAPSTERSTRLALGENACTGDFVLGLDERTELIRPGSIDAMVGLASMADVAIVGAKLLNDDGTIAHAGLVCHGGRTEPAMAGWSGEHPGPNRLLVVERECSAVSTSAALWRRDRPAVAFERTVWTPHAQWYLFGEVAVGDSCREIGRDPYYNENLAPDRGDWLERPGRSGAPPSERLADGTVVWG